jgi:hypothetical protein
LYAAEAYIREQGLTGEKKRRCRVEQAKPVVENLFAWAEVGAKYVGILQSLLVTCRMHGINPYDYLVDVLQRINQHPAAKVHLLTPRLWKQHFADNPLRSPLHNLGA